MELDFSTEEAESTGISPHNSAFSYTMITPSSSGTVIS